MDFSILKRGFKRVVRWATLAIAGLLKAGVSISPWATVIAAAVAVFTFYYGYQQFRQTQQAARGTLTLQRETLESDRESKAVELFIKYNELMLEPTSSPKSPKRPSEFWRDNLALSIAESIFKLRRDEEGWRETVKWMLSKHAENLKKKGLDCSTYDPEFVKFVNQMMQKNVCNAP